MAVRAQVEQTLLANLPVFHAAVFSLPLSGAFTNPNRMCTTCASAHEFPYISGRYPFPPPRSAV